MQSLIWSSLGWLLVVADMLDHTVSGTHTGTLVDGSLALYNSVAALGPAMVYGDFVFPTDAALVPQAVTWDTPYINPNAQVQIDGPRIQFLSDGSTAPQTIRGFALLHPGTPNVVIAAGAFTNPFNITGAGQAIVLVPSITLGQG